MDIDATKAPRTYATWKKAYDVQELAKLMVELSVQLEVELNVATVNEVFAENKAYKLEKELKQAQDHINRLEDVLHTAWYLIANVNWDNLDPELKEICYSWRDNNLRPVLKEMVQRKNKEAKP
jgi:hypothetical protein